MKTGQEKAKEAMESVKRIAAFEGAVLELWMTAHNRLSITEFRTALSHLLYRSLAGTMTPRRGGK